MNLLDILSPQTVKVPLAAADKRGVIDELVDMLAATGWVSDAGMMKSVVWERETQRTTGIGEGLAIPHGRSAAAKKLAVAMGRPAAPIDFKAIDNKPVRLVVLLVSPPDLTSDHIQALGKISRLMADAKFRIAAYNAGDSGALYELFRATEQG